MRSMRVDCEPPIRIDTYEQLATYMDGSAGTVGRIMAALLGVPPDHHADIGRLGVAFQLANFIRDVREDRRLDRIYLPAEDRDAFGVSDADLTGSSPRLRALLSHESERARAPVRRRRPRDRRRARFGPARRAPGGRPVPPDARQPAPDGRARVASAGARRSRPSGEARDARPRRADPARRAAGRADLRRELRRAGARAGAHRLRRRRADRRPVRDRRAGHERVCGADAVAARDGGAGQHPPGDPVHGVPHAARVRAFPAAVELVELRLPRRCAGRSSPRPTPASRSPRSRVARGRTVVTDRGELTAPFIVDALGWRRVLADALPAAGGAAQPRPRGPPARRVNRPGRVDRPLPRPLRLRVERARRTASSGSASAPTSRATT